MIIILTSMTLAALSFFWRWPQRLRSWSEGLHDVCLWSLPSTVENFAALESLVCGKNLENIELKHLLVQTSLIHLFIVSGSHFLFLHKILAVVFRSRGWPFLPLGLYALITLCQPPGVRSLVFLLMSEISHRRKLFCSPVILIFSSGLITLALFPAWLHSRSILMSLMAALVICFGSALWGKARNTLAAQFSIQSAVYFFMGFCLWGFSSLHPLGILLNLFLGPWIGALLFPVALLTVVMPFLGFVFDFLMATLLWLLGKTDEVLAWQALASPVGMVWQWVLFLGLLLGSYFFLVTSRQRTIHDF